MNYWHERTLKAQERLTTKTIKETEKQLAEYYKKSLESARGRFLLTYNKLLSSIEDGLTATPADLYKLDTYWKLQGQLQQELKALGEKQIALMNKKFLEEWEQVYNLWAVVGDTAFAEIDKAAAQQIINQIWCADGLAWSNRVWSNTDKLREALNEGLVDCVITGANPNQLKERLMYEFNVSYNRADSIVRTEITHIQTQAARQRYIDAGIKELEVWADKDERRCDVCGKLHKKRFLVGEAVPIPAHPRCRCAVLPVIE